MCQLWQNLLGISLSYEAVKDQYRLLLSAQYLSSTAADR